MVLEQAMRVRRDERAVRLWTVTEIYEMRVSHATPLERDAASTGGVRNASHMVRPCTACVPGVMRPKQGNAAGNAAAKAACKAG
jgi:hypothetical protein